MKGLSSGHIRCVSRRVRCYSDGAREMFELGRNYVQQTHDEGLSRSWQYHPVLSQDHSTSPDRTPNGGTAKRVCDIVIASTAIVLASPLMLAAALAIYLTMGRPVIFSHQRVGLHGRVFRCYKFRTMVNGAQERLNAYLASNPEASMMWNEQQKLPDDPRVTQLGRLLRRSSIDELPQLFNIIRGDMSCVGPRPVTDSELIERYGDRARYYRRTRPGLTGLWQVSGRSSLSYRRRIALDCAYVRRWSLLLDFYIMLKTVPALLRFRDSA